MTIAIRRALLSVSDKTGLLPLTTLLKKQGVELIASGGTADYLKKNSIATTMVEDITKFPEMLGGRVKTLHPAIHGGILARDNKNDSTDLAQHKIKRIDLVIVSLYPFEKGLAENKPHDDMIELIDIGGIALIRAAAKNYHSVAVITDPTDYDNIADEIKKTNGLSLATRRHLASKAFATTARYDQAISGWFNGKDLRYGENPHQRAKFIATNPPSYLSAMVQHHGKELSYNNYLDVDAVLRILIGLSPLKKPSSVIVKHTDPAGVAVKENIVDAFHSAFQSNPTSAFGGIIGLNRTVDDNLANEILSLKIFFEIILATTFTDQAKKILASKKDLRLLSLDPFPTHFSTTKNVRSVLGGVLEQDNNHRIIDEKKCHIASQIKPTEQEWDDLIMAMMVVKEMRSNAIAIIADGTTLGLGGGATSRVAAAERAIASAREKIKLVNHKINPIAASDGFLPFTDNIDLFYKAGVRAIIAPKGSINDDKIIKACDAKKMSLVFYDERHFYH